VEDMKWAKASFQVWFRNTTRQTSEFHEVNGKAKAPGSWQGNFMIGGNLKIAYCWIHCLCPPGLSPLGLFARNCSLPFRL